MNKPSDNEGGKVIRLPKSAQRVPIDIARAARQEFKDWKRQFIAMINRGSEIEWWQDAAGNWGKRFILSPDLCETVYEVQIREKIRAEFDRAVRLCKEKGLINPSRQEIEKVAMTAMHQEFVLRTLKTMKAFFGDQAVALEGTKTPEGEEAPSADEEEVAAESIRQMREQLVRGDLKGQITTVEEKVKAELASRQDSDESR